MVMTADRMGEEALRWDSQRVLAVVELMDNANPVASARWRLRK